jgi:hypothetical protein
LVLKAFLLARNVPVRDLKSRALGHDLEKVLDRAKSFGITNYIAISARDESEIARANRYYGAKGFEYFKVTKAVTGYRDLPDLTVLENVACRLIADLERVCLEAA